MPITPKTGSLFHAESHRHIPFNPKGRVGAILERRKALDPNAFVFGSPSGAYQPTIQTAWETLELLANGLDPRVGQKGIRCGGHAACRTPIRRTAVTSGRTCFSYPP